MKIFEVVEQVTEVLDTSAKDIDWDTGFSDSVSGEFTASNGIKYNIDIMAPYIGPDEMDPYDFIPDELKTREFDDNARFVEFQQITDNDLTYKQGVEGTGSAAEVFGIVVNGLLDYINKYKPSMLYFQAEKPNRQKLYKTIASRVLGRLPNWQFEQQGSHLTIYDTKFLQRKDLDEGASGYIPSEKEKNDPRYKMALTVDIKPDTMKKNAKKLGSKISRAGIPPQARTDGKV